MDLFKSEVLVTFIVFGFIYLIFDLIIRRQERRMMIDKMAESTTDISRYLPRGPRNGISSNGWFHIGCAFVGIGIGMVTAFFVCVGIFPGYTSLDNFPFNDEAVGAIYTAFVCMFGGLGLVIAYIIDNRKNDKRKD